ncbi:MAG TPA: hypothetical protein VM095_17330 [Pyrinomonadaceae bacterium]|nr:hypothetical protein [Pyrinomonadaceae bacterium]
MLSQRKSIFALLFMLLGSLSCAVIARAQEVHPAVDVSEGCLLGGVQKGKWLEADAIAPLLKGGERYRLYTLRNAAGKAVGAKPNSAGEPCNETVEISLTPKPERGVIAVGGDWNAQPRLPRALSTNDPAYRQAVMNILRRRGFRRPKINITQILRVDLDGDGIEEALVSATHLAEGMSINGGPMAVHGKPGDYSFVLLRRLVKGKVRDDLLVEHFYPRTLDEPSTPYQYDVGGVLDLNGDNRMEVIIHGGYYEGSWSTVFRIDRNKIENVFGCGCGA